MRKLHLVGLTTDRDGLIFTARKGSKSGGYIVPLDDKVLDAVAEARNGHPDAPDVRAEMRPAGPGVDRDHRDGRGDSSLTPREMQARLRAGRTIDEVAAEAGVENGWVARFAVPILAEQAQVVELVRGLVYAKPRLGDSAQPLNASVIQNLSDKGVFLPDDLAAAGWSAFQLHDSVWMVRFRYRSRGRDQEAQWEVDVPTGRLQARNRHASDLGYVDGGPRRHGPAHDADGDTGDADEPTGAVGDTARRTRTPAAARTGARTRTAARARPATTRTRAAAARRASTARPSSQA
ncbi:MAG: septation protein SepH, partial [Actinomycetota bacterium]|nr:septation protein SepH [Actinomycetota bacterium]